MTENLDQHPPTQVSATWLKYLMAAIIFLVLLAICFFLLPMFYMSVTCFINLSIYIYIIFCLFLLYYYYPTRIVFTV